VCYTHSLLKEQLKREHHYTTTQRQTQRQTYLISQETKPSTKCEDFFTRVISLALKLDNC
jgi:ribosomal protein L44E